MFSFIIKGIFRDRHRWLFPILIVSAGVVILVFSMAFMEGYKGSFIRQNARFETGHMKVVTRSFAEMIDTKPLDMAMVDIEADFSTWQQQYPNLTWKERISFGALSDVPDADGLTQAQGEVLGYGVDLLNSSLEIENLRLQEALVYGSLPDSPREILISKGAFERLQLAVGDTITLIGGTVYGGMSMQNFTVAGAVEFGIHSLDRGAVIADINDVRYMLDLEGGATEVLAFFAEGEYQPKQAKKIAEDFNQRYSNADDEFSPQMLTLGEQNNLGYLIKVFQQTMSWSAMIFIFILGVVLWNSGLMNGIRRYGEFGVRLAIGESKKAVYFSLLAESLIIGLIGSAIGTLLGLGISMYFSHHGMDVSAYTRNTTILSENVIYTSVTPKAILASFIPGFTATLLGTALAGTAIFKRQISQLFKELES